ncbi:unnamed protein product [Cuscuta campestris]|uniref:U-box domain-containing protein n=1 Tax=Cuscuta campestris TaxID=132261 RepID=A0A484MI36_9ASTE|nr:unnamed protein product [Cuscuta campestris]
MTFFFSLRRATGRGSRKNKISRPDDSRGELTIPNSFVCPISLELMKDPVTLSTGISYDRESIERWLDAGNVTCPLTNQVLESRDLIPNHAIRKTIQDWCVENTSRGVDRIPTPRIPVGPSQVSDICSRIEGATRRGDHARCLELVGRVRAWSRESERNKKCIRGDGGAIGVALAACFELFAGGVSGEEHVELLRDLMSLLSWMFPLAEEGRTKLGSKTSLQCMAWLLKGGEENTLSVLQQLMCLEDGQFLPEALLEADQDVPKTLLDIVKLPIHPSGKSSTTKAALTIMHHMMTRVKSVNSFLAEAGLVSVLVELLVDGDKSLCEKGLAVLDAVCSSEEGRERACGHPLTIPLLVKKTMRVSELGTELCVSAMLKLCKGGGSGGERAAAVEALLEVGAFQKLLVVLQVGCGEKSKEKATEVLKLLNGHKERVIECLDSSSNGFKYLKRSF